MKFALVSKALQFPVIIAGTTHVQGEECAHLSCEGSNKDGAEKDRVSPDKCAVHLVSGQPRMKWLILSGSRTRKGQRVDLTSLITANLSTSELLRRLVFVISAQGGEWRCFGWFATDSERSFNVGLARCSDHPCWIW